MLGPGVISGVQQVALVVTSLDQTIQKYSEHFGIGPWWVALFEPPHLTDMRIRGETASYSMKIAIAWTGNVMWAIIQPIEGPSIYKEFLEKHGEGIHHVLVEHEGKCFDSMIASFSSHRHTPLMEGRFGEVRFAYLDTEAPLKTVLEIVHRPTGFVRPEPDYWYPSPPET